MRLPLRFPILLFTCGLLMFPQALPGQAGPGSKPPERGVALVGDSFGRHEVTSLVRNILDQSDWLFEEAGAFLDPEQFPEYSLVILAHSQERPFTAGEQRQVQEYLRGGGRLLLIHLAPRNTADADSEEAQERWLGLRARYQNRTVETGVLQRDDPIFEGVLGAEEQDPSWLAANVLAAPTSEEVEVLAGTDTLALVARRAVGEGSVYYLGSELFRMRLTNSPHLEDSESYIRLIRNIIEEADPITLARQREGLEEEWIDNGTRFLVWDREWQRGRQEGPRFIPALPGPEELIEEKELHLAVAEQEAVQMNLTDLGAGGVVEWNIDLDGLPSEAIRIFVQDRPDPIPWPRAPELAVESPFWLMPPEALEPEERDAVMIDSGETRIFWIYWDTTGVEPGRYTPSVTFLVDGETAGEVRFAAEIYPVRLPAKRLITLQPVGHVYGDVNSAEPALRFKRNLRDLGAEWSLINTFRKPTFRVEGGPELTGTFLRTHLDEIGSDHPPAIDFSAMDEYLLACMEHNLTFLRVTNHLTESINSLAAAGGLEEEQQTVARRWFASQFRRYLQDLGFREVVISMGDEMNEEALRDRFLPWSEDLAEVGLKTHSTFSGPAVADPELTTALAANVGAWTLNRIYVPMFLEWKRDGTIEVPSDALVGTYGAGEGRGTEIRKNLSESRMIGWEAWGLGYDYCGPNPYFKGWLYYIDYRADRGLAGERFVSYLDIDDLDAPLVNSPFLEGIRESMEEANLAAMLDWYLDRLDTPKTAAIRERAAAVVGHDGILAWQPRQYLGTESVILNSNREEYAEAKRTILELLEKTRPLVEAAGIGPDLFWNRIALVRNGTPVARLTGSQAPMLREMILEETGFDLPVDGVRVEEAETLLLVGTPGDSSLSDWTAWLGGHVDLESLPYGSWIRDDSENEVAILWVGGRSEEEVQSAMERFRFFLRPEGNWFVAQ